VIMIQSIEIAIEQNFSCKQKYSSTYPMIVGSSWQHHHLKEKSQGIVFWMVLLKSP